MSKDMRTASSDAKALQELFGRLVACDDSNDIELGTVKWYDPDKGYGFIMPDSGGPELFVHRSSIEMRDGRLMDGQRVEFRTKAASNGKGPRAERVRFTLIPPPFDESEYRQEIGP